MVVWVSKVYWIQFRSMMSNFSFGASWYWCINIFVGIFGLDTCLLLFWIICSLAASFLMTNGPLKGHISNFLSFCINNSLTPLLVSPYPIQSSFRYGIEEVLGILKDFYLYCWPVGLCTCWRWFDPLLWWRLFPISLLTICSIMQWAVDMSISYVSKFSNNYSIMKWNIVESWCLCGFH